MLRLKQIQLSNFKGVKDLLITPEGKDTSIWGDNGTGKTTVYDAFLWVFFDKDSLGQKDFDIKTISIDGNVESGLDHAVSIILTDEQNEISFKKVFSEKWVKERGAADKVFSGHTVDYFIDDVPVKKKDYTTKIESLGVTELTFKLLTSPIYFNERLHWQERRKILIELCGDVTDQEVVDTKEALRPLLEIIRNRSFEDFRKVLNAQKKTINEELDKLPIRIDEVVKSRPDIADIDFLQIEKRISDLIAVKSQKQISIVRIQTGGEVAQKDKQLAELHTDLINIQNENSIKSNEELKALNLLLSQKTKELNAIENTILTLKHNESLANSVQIKLESEVETLRNKYKIESSKIFQYESECICPTCKQMLPKQDVESARQTALGEFNLQKSKTLSEIQTQGKTFAGQLEEVKTNRAKFKHDIEASEQIKKVLNERITELNTFIKDEEGRATTATPTKEYEFILSTIESVKKEIEAIKLLNVDEIKKLEQENIELTEQVSALNTKYALKKQFTDCDSRIAVLKAEQKTLSAKYEDLEQQLFMTEDFVRTKVQLMDAKINSKFETVRFKMFDQQINGGIAECCEVTYNGVPYSSVNNAARINVGLEIINVLSEHYKFNAPIFIDNREAVTKLKKVKSQVISLIVSEKDKALRIEVA